MTVLLKHGDEFGNLSCWLLNALAVFKYGLIKDVLFNELFSNRQRAAIIRYLKQVAHNNHSLDNGDAQRRLRHIPTRT